MDLKKDDRHPYRVKVNGLKNVEPTESGKDGKHVTKTGRIEKMLEERELRKLEAEEYDE